jgi:hypothetical protein
MTERPCGCCAGTVALTPAPAGNRPGLDALRYRVGTHGTFLETMLARLSGHALDDGRRPLERLTTRAPDDPAIALLDAWATVADVLTFYQERIANEGYLPTATERRSILEMARLVGYRVRPGVAASVFLAFTLEQGYRLDVPAGTRAQSIPGPGELPQFFETDEALPARTEWNAIPARLTRPTVLRTDASFVGTRRFRVKGVVNTVRANDAILFACASCARPYVVQSAAPDAAAATTLVTYVPFGGLVAAAHAAPDEPAGKDDHPATLADGHAASTGASTGTGAEPAARRATALARLSPIVAALRKDASVPPASRFQLERSAGQTYAAAADLGPRLLTRFDPRLRDTLYPAYAAAPVTSAEAACTVHALRVKAGLYGGNAPQELRFVDNVPAGRREWALAEFGATGRLRLAGLDGKSVTEALGGTYDLATTVNPLQFVVSLDDGEGGTRYTETFTALGLVRVARPPFPPNPRFAMARQLPGGGELEVSVTYAGTAVVYTLASVEVRFRVWPGHETLIRVSPPDPNGPGIVVTPGGFVRVQVDEDAPRFPSFGKTTVETIGSRTVTVAMAAALEVAHRTPELATDRQLRTLSLDAAYEAVVAGSWAVVRRGGGAPLVAAVQSVATVARGDYGVTGRVTQLVLDRHWLGSPATSPALDPGSTLALLRGVTVHAGSEPLELADERIETDVRGGVIELDGLYDGLEAGRWLMVKGVRTDVPGLEEADADRGVVGTELVMLAGVAHEPGTAVDEQGEPLIRADGTPVELPGETLHTRITLAEELKYSYRRDRFTVNANVARATHGETRSEILGSGDGTQAFQQFALKQKPLTWLAAPTPSGVRSTLEVRVHEVRWPERETLLGLGPGDRGYTTRTDDEGTTTVVFGDGVRGTRLPTGVENVSAVYRSGIGRGGNVDAEAISVLATRPLGVKEVLNPQRASGGADPETRDQARRNVPVAVLALGRLVAVRDYADFARVFAGIGKASAAALSDGRRRVVHLTVAGADDVPIDRASELYRNLLLALARFGDPGVPVQVDPREAVFLFVAARVKVAADYLWKDVEPRVRAALLLAFGFDRRGLGEDVLLSQVISTAQAVEGVDYVDVDLLDGVSEGDAATVETLAARLEALAASAAPSAPGTGCAAERQPRRRVTVHAARVDPTLADPAKRLRPAQLAYLDPGLPDTLVLTEVTA